MTDPTPRLPVLGSRLITAGLVAGVVYFGLIINWGNSRGTVVSMATFVGALLLIGRFLPDLRRDIPPTAGVYYAGMAAGALGGLAKGLLEQREPLFASVFAGVFFGLFWFWFGHLLRAPFGAKAWPPYSKE